MSPTLLAAATGCSPARAAFYAEPLAAAMDRWSINTPLRQAAFLGQLAHESALFSRVEEDLHYSAKRLTQVFPSRFPDLSAAASFAHNPVALANRVYGGRMGNTAPGDGYKYRGRGLIQLTGYDNYKAYGEASCTAVLAYPDLVTEPRYSADSAGWFWHSRDLNRIADSEDGALLTRRINGGLTGLSDRIRAINRAKAALL